MSSDLPAARIYLQLASERLDGDDQVSKDARLAIGLVVRAIDHEERKAASPITVAKRLFNLVH